MSDIPSDLSANKSENTEGVDSRYNNIRVVMVNTSHPGNVGAAARAIKTMGLKRLYLVAPQEFPSDQATWRASGAGDVLENAVVSDTFAEAIDDCDLVIGASARLRRIPWPLLNPRQCGRTVAVESSNHQVALVFGREDRGLTNEELQRCNFHVTIPSNEEYGVLNVASAIQVIAYEIRTALLEVKGGFDESNANSGSESGEVHAQSQLMEVETVRWDEKMATSSELEYFYQHLEETLVELDFHDRENPRQLMTRFRRLYNRSRPDHMEINILRGMLTAINKKFK